MGKEIPILFSTPMVDAILQDRKTITRRTKGLENITPAATEVIRSDQWKKQGDWVARYKTQDEPERYTATDVIKCPYGKVGDLFWVRESWRVHSWCPDDGEITVGFLTDDETVTCYDLNEEMFTRLWEQSCNDLDKAGYELTPDERYIDYDVKDLRLRPSIHMPKEASRIWLEITNIRVERLHDISENDAKAEGVLVDEVDIKSNEMTRHLLGEKVPKGDYQIGFMNLWAGINGPDSWDSNPWVWVIEFKKVNKPT